MDETIFEGTIVLERMNEIGKIDEFFEAIDSDNFHQAKRLMKAAGIDIETITIVLKKMSDSDGNH